MNILVCIKQVPDTTIIKIDPETNTLMREGVPAIVSPFDAYALEAAARIKDKYKDTKIVVLSMGPEQALAALKECLSVGGDKAYLVSDRACGGSDTLATGYILSKAKEKVEELEGIKFDMLMFGKQAIDGDTAQVGLSGCRGSGHSPGYLCLGSLAHRGWPARAREEGAGRGLRDPRDGLPLRCHRDQARL